MLTRAHVQPFLRVERGRIHVAWLEDPGDGRVIDFLDRLCRLVRRLHGAPRSRVAEALRRQERRVRDAARLAGLAKTLLDVCEFEPPPGAGRAPELRAAVFGARGRRWPPVPGDREMPYAEAGEPLGLEADEVERLLYADLPAARLLVRAPPAAFDGHALLARYNLELARGVLLDAERLRITARGGWRGIFRAVKAARLMHVLARAGRGYRLELTGPAAPFIVRPSRYGVRLARVIPALARAPGWRLDADIRRGGELVRFVVRGRSRSATSPVGRRAERTGYDSAWERSLAAELRARFGAERDGWRLSRETTPVPAGDELMLPDFTLRHADGREALVEVVGFWTPDYLESKARKVAAAGLDNLILVVYRGLAVGKGASALTSAAGTDRIVWFAERPKAAEVIRAAERWAR
jgi:hypothetical protein